MVMLIFCGNQTVGRNEIMAGCSQLTLVQPGKIFQEMRIRQLKEVLLLLLLTPKMDYQ